MIRSVTACSLAFFSHIAFSDTLEERSINAQLHTNNFLQECSKNVSMIINKAKKGLVGLGPSDDPDCSGFFIDIEKSQKSMMESSDLFETKKTYIYSLTSILPNSIKKHIQFFHFLWLKIFNNSLLTSNLSIPPPLGQKFFFLLKHLQTP